MGWAGYCEACHHLHVLPNYFNLYEYFLDHSQRSHKSTADERVHIWYITPTEYKDYVERQKNKDSRIAFWRGWRLSKQVANNPLFSGLVTGRIAFLKFACL